MKKFFPQINYVDSWELAKTSFVFLGQNKDLNLIPALSLGSILLFLGCLVGTFSDIGFFSDSYLHYVFSTLLYFVLTFNVIYLNTVLIAVVLKRLNQEPASIHYGFGIANKRLTSIILWSLMVSTLGLFAKLFEGLQHLCEKLIGYSLGMTWSVASYFVLPFLVIENINPIQAIQKSKKTVGKGFKNTMSVQSLAAIILSFVLIILTEFVFQYPSEILQIIIWVAPFLLVGYVLVLTLESIVISALYLNHAELRSIKHFDSTLLNRAFRKDE